MRRAQSVRCGGSVAEAVLILLLILVFASLWVRPWPHRPNYAQDVKQKVQFRSMDVALELLRDERGDYPPSDADDSTGQPYCGALKLAEAIVGQDLLGFHMRSTFRADGLDPNGSINLYSGDPAHDSLTERKGPYLQAENANAHRLADIYGLGNTDPFSEDLYVLCDTYERKRPGGAKTGMPILYYRADSKGTTHDVNDPDNPANIYNYRDDLALLKLGVPGDPRGVHPLVEPRRFYLNTQSDKHATQSRPCREDTYILISAGRDGLYGTADDVCNFDWKYRE